MSGRLAGIGVVVTRPEPAAGALAASLMAEGANVWRFPALAIRDLPHDAALEALLARLGYKQELRRRLSGFSNFAVSFSIISANVICPVNAGLTWS